MVGNSFSINMLKKTNKSKRYHSALYNETNLPEIIVHVKIQFSGHLNSYVAITYKFFIRLEKGPDLQHACNRNTTHLNIRLWESWKDFEGFVCKEVSRGYL